MMRNAIRKGIGKGVCLLWMAVLCTACGEQPQSAGQTQIYEEQTENTRNDASAESSTLIYASGDYTRINPAMDEHGEINLLLFDGLTAHNGENEVVPALAKSWEFDEDSCTYTFYLEEGVSWHDGEPFTAEDVKFTIEAIMNPENGSENAPNFEDVEEIRVIDEQTVAFVWQRRMWPFWTI